MTDKGVELTALCEKGQASADVHWRPEIASADDRAGEAAKRAEAALQG